MKPFGHPWANAMTIEQCGAAFLADSKRRLVVTLEAADLIVLRPERTRRRYAITAKDLFRRLLQAEAARELLERARAAKARKAQRLADARERRAERRLLRP